MKTPVLTAQQIAAQYPNPLDLGITVIVPTPYEIDHIPFMGKFKLTRTGNGVMIACPACGCSVRHLYAAIGSNGERRPGLWCVDCQVKADHGGDHRIGYRRKVAKKGKAA